MGYYYKDLTGQKFNMITVLKYTNLRDKYGRVMWECKCDCGNLKLMPASDVQRAKSCGCLVKFSYEKAAINRIIRDYKNRAPSRGYKFELTNEQIKSLLVCNCYYCNAPPLNQCKSRDGKHIFLYNGIDRLDNNIGYIISNVVSCCSICNRMKMILSLNDFINQCKKIAEIHIKV